MFTINRTLANLLGSAIVAISGQIPANLHIAAFYDFMLDCVALFESREKYRLVDERSRERIAFSSSRDFYQHRRNVFADKKVRKLVKSIEARDVSTLNASRYFRDGLNASRYLRDEMIYIQSAVF